MLYEPGRATQEERDRLDRDAQRRFRQAYPGLKAGTPDFNEAMWLFLRMEEAHREMAGTFGATEEELRAAARQIYGGVDPAPLPPRPPVRTDLDLLLEELDAPSWMRDERWVKRRDERDGSMMTWVTLPPGSVVTGSTIRIPYGTSISCSGSAALVGYSIVVDDPPRPPVEVGRPSRRQRLVEASRGALNLRSLDDAIEDLNRRPTRPEKKLRRI